MKETQQTSRDAGETEARREVLDAALAMSRRGLSPGRSGNVSRRWGDGMLVTPSGMAYDELEPGDIVRVAADGGVPPGQRKPSSEWRFHLAAYRARPDRDALVHTHSLNASALACAGRAIPAFHYMVAVAGGSDIPLVPYATFGTEALARRVARGLAERDACLMANHGQIAMGRTCRQALDLAAEVETLAAMYIRVLAVGEPVILGRREMQRVLERFKGYGQGE